MKVMKGPQPVLRMIDFPKGSSGRPPVARLPQPRLNPTPGQGPPSGDPRRRRGRDRLTAGTHPDPVEPSASEDADAQLALAPTYQASSWPRIVEAVHLTDAIWRDDIEAVRSQVTTNPDVIREETLIRKDSNWGPPITYAANVRRDRILGMLHSLGATD